MLSNNILAPGLLEAADGISVEYFPAVLDEVRRLAVEGLVAFGHGGLECGGVLYGSRDGNRVSVLASAALLCEHALGPGFVLSGNDRQAFATLLEAPAGLQTVGWYRSHTRKGLELDARDHELFDQFFAQEKTIGLVLKPTHWGPSAAAFYVRAAGGIVPHTPREFLLEPLAYAADGEADVETRAAVETADPPLALAVIEPCEAAFEARESGRADKPSLPGLRRSVAAAILLGLGLAGIYYWNRPPRDLALEAYAIAPGQVRIDWNHRSLPVADAVSAVLQIRDADSVVTIPLDANQLSSSSITYTQTSNHITVKLHVERRKRGAAAAEEAIEFVGPPEPRAPNAATAMPALAQAEPAAKVAEVSSLPVPQTRRNERDRERVDPPAEPQPLTPSYPRRRFQLSPRQNSPTVVATALPVAPPTPNLAAPQPAMPELLSKPQTLPKPASQVYTGPRSGRLIWTGELGRRGVVEIEGGRASIGSLSGSLSAQPSTVHVWPAEFTREGLAVFTMDGAAHGRKEQPSMANGWNSVRYQFDPVRSRELVVLEAPNRVNGFDRLVVRNDARSCPVIVVDWSLQ